MVELKDEEDGRVALIMGEEELPFAVEGLMRAGYGPTPETLGVWAFLGPCDSSVLCMPWCRFPAL
jgi:hypothetical protein